MSNLECMYCDDCEKKDNLMIEFMKLPSARVFLFKDQMYKGRCIVAYDEHETELFLMPQNKRDEFMNSVSKVAGAITEAFGANKINYAAYGDGVPHMHFHIVPKYKNVEGLFGNPFSLSNETPVYLTDAEYGEIIDALKENLA